MANNRTKAKIEARIQERVATCLEFELSDPRASFLTVTSVQLNDDLSIARILYSVFGSEGDRSKVQHMLEDAKGFVRTRLSKSLTMRRVPSIQWEYDDSVERQDEMERRIKAALDSDRAINPEAHDD